MTNEQKENESEHVRSLYGHPSGDWQAFGVFGSVVKGGGLGRTTLFMSYWDAAPRDDGYRGGGGWRAIGMQDSGLAKV